MTKQRQHRLILQHKSDQIITQPKVRQKPVVTPFKIKWPSDFQLQIIMSQQGLGGTAHNNAIIPAQIPVVTPQAQEINQIFHHKRLTIMTITVINICIITALSWLLYTGLVCTPWFVALDCMLLVSMGPIFWYLHNQLHHSPEHTTEIADLDDYIEEDFSID